MKVLLPTYKLKSYFTLSPIEKLFSKAEENRQAGKKQPLFH
jgi:hypothetical protein